MAAAKVGIEVILKDISVENAEKGKAYVAGQCDKLQKRGRMDAEKSESILGLIKPTAEAADLAGCDVIIEAVFEDRKIKAVVTQESEAVTDENCVFASNTSSLPITGLAESASRPENYIGTATVQVARVQREATKRRRRLSKKFAALQMASR